jgi:hypothetical protein
MELRIKQEISIKTVQDILTLLYGTTDVVFRNGNLLDFRKENIILKSNSYYTYGNPPLS